MKRSVWESSTKYKRKRSYRPLWHRVSHRLISKEGGLFCHYCHINLIPPNTNPKTHRIYYKEKYFVGRFVKWVFKTREDEFDRLTIDHKIPRTQGGQHNIDNLVLCCKTCNVEKGKRGYNEFYQAKADERLLRDIFHDYR